MSTFANNQSTRCIRLTARNSGGISALNPSASAHQARVQHCCSRKGFTLIEVIGALTILAILIAIIVSVTIRSLDIAASNLESTNLVSYAKALESSILRTRYIPGPTGTSNWAEMIAAELGVNTGMVSTNARNSRRVLMVDPANTVTVPFSQTPAGTGSTDVPVLRFMILSSLGSAFPPDLTDGTTADFGLIWSNSDGVLPTVPASNPLHSWVQSGRGDDLKVQRMDLSPLFVHLLLCNYPYPYSPQGQYRIDSLPSTAPLSVFPTSLGTNIFLLRNTVLSLIGDNGQLQVDQMLSRDAAFFYIGPQHIWRGTLNLGDGLGVNGATADSRMGAVFAATVDAFVNSPHYTMALNNTTPRKVVTAMTNFLAKYIAYVEAGFPPQGNMLREDALSAQLDMAAAMGAQLGVANLNNGLPSGGPTAGACSNAPAQ